MKNAVTVHERQSAVVDPAGEGEAEAGQLRGKTLQRSHRRHGPVAAEEQLLQPGTFAWLNTAEPGDE